LLVASVCSSGQKETLGLTIGAVYHVRKNDVTAWIYCTNGGVLLLSIIIAAFRSDDFSGS